MLKLLEVQLFYLNVSSRSYEIYFWGSRFLNLCCVDRYYGNSTPYEILDLKALQYLTLNNSVADMVNFARNVELPFDTNHSSNAPQAVSQ